MHMMLVYFFIVVFLVSGFIVSISTRKFSLFFVVAAVLFFWLVLASFATPEISSKQTLQLIYIGGRYVVVTPEGIREIQDDRLSPYNYKKYYVLHVKHKKYYLGISFYGVKDSRLDDKFVLGGGD